LLIMTSACSEHGFSAILADTSACSISTMILVIRFN
jgi:hypothetical protein